MPTTRALSAAVLLSTATLLSCSLTACVPAAQHGNQGGGGTRTAADGQDEGRFRKQSLDWRECPAPAPIQGGGEAPRPLPDGTRWQCTTMQAPLDWKKPAGKAIGIELIRARSGADADDRIGSLLFSALSCDGWPVPGETEHPEVSAPGAPPILLVGNTGDPATPYEGAARMAERLGRGVGFELTYRGEGHGAYDSGNTCVRSAVNSYLLDGKLPRSGAVCEAEPLPEGK